MANYLNKVTGLVWEITGDLLKQVAYNSDFELVKEVKLPKKSAKAIKTSTEVSTSEVAAEEIPSEQTTEVV